MDSPNTIWAMPVPRLVPPLLQRILIIDPDDNAVAALVAVLRSISHCQVWTAEEDEGVDLAGRIAATTIFVEQSAGQDGGAVVRTLRRSGTPAARAVAIMMTPHPTMFGIVAARECGAHEVLRKPFARSDLVRRLEVVALEPREWIETATYFGPDRRRFNSGDHASLLRSTADGGDRNPHGFADQRASAA
jgi:DNA-binding response OmpR family regulator